MKRHIGPLFAHLTAALLMSSMLACGSAGPPATDETCATPAPPALALRDCAGNEPAALTAMEYACTDSAGPYSLTKWIYPQQGQTFLFRNNVTMLAADGQSIPACWRYRGVDAAADLRCTLKYLWSRCASATPTPPSS